MKVILAPHLDDEVIGCFSVLGEVDLIAYFTLDYRQKAVADNDHYLPYHAFNSGRLTKADTIYIPSRYDYHPLHKRVRAIGMSLPAQKMFYSVEMNVPWLEEEENHAAKKMLFDHLYPGENMPNPKYWLFRSVKPYDEVTWASVRWTEEHFHAWPEAPEPVTFLRHRHRHLFHFQVDVQQYPGDRELEYFCLRDVIREVLGQGDPVWKENTSCEAAALEIKRRVEAVMAERLVRVHVYEDGENGCVVE